MIKAKIGTIISRLVKRDESSLGAIDGERLPSILLRHKELKSLAIREIYAAWPHFKFREEFGKGFVDFVVAEHGAEKAGVILDLGAHDGYFAHEVSRRLPLVDFICVDNIRRDENYFSKRVVFIENDIISWLSENFNQKSCDSVLLSGTLSVFSTEDRIKILSWVRRHQCDLFLREVPRYSDMVDVYLDRVAHEAPVYELFTESSLRELLETTGFSVKKILRDTDYFVHASPA